MLEAPNGGAAVELFSFWSLKSLKSLEDRKGLLSLLSLKCWYFSNEGKGGLADHRPLGDLGMHPGTGTLANTFKAFNLDYLLVALPSPNLWSFLTHSKKK